MSSLVVFQHLLDGTNSHIDSGESRLFLVGKYLDKFRFVEGEPRFVIARSVCRTDASTKARTGRSDASDPVVIEAPLPGGPMGWKYLCDAAEIEPNAIKIVQVAGVRILVANYGAGFRAMPPICPHMEEPLAESGVIANCVLTCTKHLWSWDLRSLE